MTIPNWWLLLETGTTEEVAKREFLERVGRAPEDYKSYPSGVLVGPLTDEEGKEVERKRRGG